METPNTHPTLLDRIRSRKLTATFTILATLSLGILVGSVITSNVSGKEQQAVNSSDAKPLIIPSPVELSNGFSKIVKEVSPAVVNINTEELPKQNLNRRGRRATPPDSDDDSQQAPNDNMQDFFNRFFGGQGGDDDGLANTERRALGSGFIVDPRGYIITNNHVVDKADKIFVKLSTDPDGDNGDNGRPATVIGVDKDTDIAVIKIDTKEPLPTVKLGNSGGPLVDMSGEVVGMNTAIYTQSMGSQGVGFAMPANTIAQIYNMLIGPQHKVVRGSIGISFQQSLNSAVNRMYGFQNGVIVSTVTPSGGAAKAGIQPGDVIVSIDGRNIKDGDDLVNDISARKIGSTVKLGYLRNGKQSTADVAIGDRAKTYADLTGGNDEETNPAAPQAPDAGKSLLGITVAAIPPAVSARTGNKSGVIITSVRPGSFADEIGLPKGFIITEINKKPVTDEASYRAIVSTLKSKDDVVFVVQSPLQKNLNSYVGGTLP